MEFLNQILAFITNNLMASTGTVAIVLEVIFRFIPTKKPLSILWIVRDFLVVLASVLTKIAEFLDKILPQRTA